MDWQKLQIIFNIALPLLAIYFFFRGQRKENKLLEQKENFSKQRKLDRDKIWIEARASAKKEYEEILENELFACRTSYEEKIRELEKELKNESDKGDAFLKWFEEKAKEAESLLSDLEKCNKKGIENAKKIQELEKTLSQYAIQKEHSGYEIKQLVSENKALQRTKKNAVEKATDLEKNLQLYVDNKLLQLVQKTALAQRYISEMYRRGDIDLQTRQDTIRKTEILHEIENKIIDEKNAQILTREGRLQLEMNTNVFELKKSSQELRINLDNFNLDKRDYEYNKRIEQEKWEIKQQLDVFQQIYALQ